MTTLLQKPEALIEGRKYRFIVSSAEEAVRVIHERMGERARVVSVRQVDGKGLSRFLASPKLEVIATIPTDEPDPVLQSGDADAYQPRIDEPSADVSPPQSETTAGAREGHPQERLGALLRRAGFDGSLLGPLKNSPQWQELEGMAVPHALARVSLWLREEFDRARSCDVSRRIAFLGTPGCGKTTALCKRLAADVFLRGKTVQVLKLEGDTPNADDALSVFCDVLGVNLLRDPVELDDIAGESELYIDMPGISMSQEDEQGAFKEQLDFLGIDTRVLVVNAAYETDIIKENYACAERMGATHIVFTHLDEVSHYTKLWQFILRGGLTPWFFSHGQNITSDFTEDVLNYLMEQTFPTNLLT